MLPGKANINIGFARNSMSGNGGDLMKTCGEHDEDMRGSMIKTCGGAMREDTRVRGIKKLRSRGTGVEDGWMMGFEPTTLRTTI